MPRLSLATAKVFTNGNSQAIRLPKERETLRKRRLDALMAAIADNPLPDNFLSDASWQNKPPKNPSVDWVTGAKCSDKRQTLPHH